MQTFLPFADFNKTFKVLDYRRLGKQRVETLQILQVLFKIKSTPNAKVAWQNHPAVKQWQGHEPALGLYGVINCIHWINLGYKDTCLAKITEMLQSNGIDIKKYPELPDFIGNDKFHASHRSNLLDKDFAYYSQFGWDEKPGLPYVWPSKT